VSEFAIPKLTYLGGVTDEVRLKVSMMAKHVTVVTWGAR
jgi:hypothetical protein